MLCPRDWHAGTAAGTTSYVRQRPVDALCCVPDAGWGGLGLAFGPSQRIFEED